MLTIRSKFLSQMAEIKQQEKAVDPEGRETVAVMSLDSMGATGAVVPSGWMYKSFHIGRWATPYYASPMTQLLLVSFVCFLCPGMYNALNGLGGGGISNADASNKAAIALNSTFAVVGFFSGSIINKLGLTLCLIIGGSGYSIYVGALLSWKLHENLGFVIFGGAFLGFSAALLWTAQGTIMMSYPEERRKGRFIAIFWGIFNLGAVIGSLVSQRSLLVLPLHDKDKFWLTSFLQVPLGQNSANKSNAVGNGTYIAFIVLTLLGAVVGGTLISPLKVVRADGTHVIAMKHPSWKSEIVGMWEVLKAHSYIVALFPMFFASNWFYTYQFNAVNLAYFNIRTRSLNNVVYWSAQIIGAFAFGYGLDYPGIRRVTRARIGTGALFLLTIGIWAGGYVFQKGYTRESVTSGLTPKKDWTDSGYIGPMFLYLFYGFFDAAWQTTAYW